MAWHRTDHKPLSEPITAYFIDAYTRHSAAKSKCDSDVILLQILFLYQVTLN